MHFGTQKTRVISLLFVGIFSFHTLNVTSYFCSYSNRLTLTKKCILKKFFQANGQETSPLYDDNRKCELSKLENTKYKIQKTAKMSHVEQMQRGESLEEDNQFEADVSL